MVMAAKNWKRGRDLLLDQTLVDLEFVRTFDAKFCEIGMQRVQQVVELATDDCARNAQNNRSARIQPVVTQSLQPIWSWMNAPIL